MIGIKFLFELERFIASSDDIVGNLVSSDVARLLISRIYRNYKTFKTQHGFTGVASIYYSIRKSVGLLKVCS